MTDDQFRILCNTYGFAPSRALRELIDAATAQAVISEREGCAVTVQDFEFEFQDDSVGSLLGAANAIRARDKKEPRQA